MKASLRLLRVLGGFALKMLFWPRAVTSCKLRVRTTCGSGWFNANVTDLIINRG